MEYKQFLLEQSVSTVFIYIFFLSVTHLIQLIKHRIITVTDEFNQEHWSQLNLGNFLLWWSVILVSNLRSISVHSVSLYRSALVSPVLPWFVISCYSWTDGTNKTQTFRHKPRACAFWLGLNSLIYLGMRLVLCH